MAGTGVVGFRLGKDDAPVRAEILGLKEIQRDLRRLGDDTKNELKDTHKAAAEIVVLGAKRYVPYRTGRLANSIRAIATQSSGRVRVGSAAVPYAGPIHFGWPARKITPNPFVYDAMDTRVEEIRGLYEKRIMELIERYDLSTEQPLKQARAVRAAAGIKSSTGRMPDALLRDAAGSIIGGVYEGEAVYF